MLIAQITGHLWIYPQPIATDWDATLASMPYFTLKKQADTYLQQQKIPKTAVGSKFPLINSPQQTHLNNDTTHLQRIDEGQISRFEYVLYSNISNDFSATEITQLQTHWQVQQQWSKGFVQLVLYKNNQWPIRFAAKHGQADISTTLNDRLIPKSFFWGDVLRQAQQPFDKYTNPDWLTLSFEQLVYPAGFSQIINNQ